MVAMRNHPADDGALEVIKAMEQYQTARSRLTLVCRSDQASLMANAKLMENLADLLQKNGYAERVARMAAALMALGLAQVTVDEIVLAHLQKSQT